MKTVEVGDNVELDYTAKLEGGEVFATTLREEGEQAGIEEEDTTEYGPITIAVGSSGLLPGLESALIGMSEDEEKNVSLPCEDAFGPVREELFRKVPLSVFLENKIVPQPGTWIRSDNGVAVISEVIDADVTLDYNHPLAGEDLCFDLCVRRIIKSEEVL